MDPILRQTIAQLLVCALFLLGLLAWENYKDGQQRKRKKWWK